MKNELDRISEDSSLWWAEFWNSAWFILKAVAVISFLVMLKYFDQNN